MRYRGGVGISVRARIHSVWSKMAETANIYISNDTCHSYRKRHCPIYNVSLPQQSRNKAV